MTPAALLPWLLPALPPAGGVPVGVWAVGVVVGLVGVAVFWRRVKRGEK